ncbi:hypothetical protein PC121_g3401 [Phytophthora cactorum]|nr:hypothetical protein PC120_g3911 [Phytophthora cactorum]KAG3093143.1 hypothetical protein PC121_g3401 [Phytophthora cactorum]KAG4056682.1 hypothetical protein PC123_g8292 [Phytophthora cactorum]
MCKATCGAERYPKDRDIEVPRVRLAHHDESIEQGAVSAESRSVKILRPDWWCVPTGNPCVRGSRTSLGVDEHETACVLTGNPACTKARASLVENEFGGRSNAVSCGSCRPVPCIGTCGAAGSSEIRTTECSTVE